MPKSAKICIFVEIDYNPDLSGCDDPGLAFEPDSHLQNIGRALFGVGQGLRQEAAFPIRASAADTLRGKSDYLRPVALNVTVTDPWGQERTYTLDQYETNSFMPPDPKAQVFYQDGFNPGRAEPEPAPEFGPDTAEGTECPDCHSPW